MAPSPSIGSGHRDFVILSFIVSLIKILSENERFGLARVCGAKVGAAFRPRYYPAFSCRETYLCHGEQVRVLWMYSSSFQDFTCVRR